MSNLILPPAAQENFIDKNLRALFARYPHERSRLDPILRKSVAPQPLISLEVPPAPSQPPMRVLLLLGIANPQFLAQLLNDDVVRRENFKVFIVENNEDFLAHWFQNADLSQIINFQKTEWFLCQTVDSMKPALFRALKPEAVTSMMLNVQVLEPHVPKTEEVQKFYSAVPPIYQETCGHIFHNHGNLDDSLLGIEVTLRNKQWLLDSPGIHDLKNHYEGCAAVIVGAGPSLDQSLETLKKYNDRFVVIAVDAALKPLMKAGIRVDYVTSIERLNDYQKPFFEGIEKTDAELIAFPVLHPDVLALYPGQVRIVYRNYSFFAYFEKILPKGILRSGGSTSHLGLRFADHLGCSKVFLVALDSAYEEKDGLFRSHCSDTGHPEWGNFIPLAEFNKNRRHSPPLTALNNLGQNVTTNMTYYQWAKEYAEELAYLGQRIAIKNCSPTGLQMGSIPFVPLETLAASLDPIVVEKARVPAAEITRAWNNRDLIKNFESWGQASNDVIAECDALSQMDEPDQARFNALMYVYNFRFCIDDLFVAFIIQVAARRFFELENKWWAYRLDYGADKKEKVAVIKERFQLFARTIERLIKMFQEEGEVNGIQIHQQRN